MWVLLTSGEASQLCGQFQCTRQPMSDIELLLDSLKGCYDCASLWEGENHPTTNLLIVIEQRHL